MMQPARFPPRAFVQRLRVEGVPVDHYPHGDGRVRIRSYLSRAYTPALSTQVEGLLHLLADALDDSPTDLKRFNALTAQARGRVTRGSGSERAFSVLMSLIWAHRERLRTRLAFRPFEAHFDTDNPLQSMADAGLFGLDCIGFASRYVQAAGVVTYAVQCTPPQFTRLASVRPRERDVRPLDFIVWANGNHIAVVDAVDGWDDHHRMARVSIAQSTSGGPQVNAGITLTSVPRTSTDPAQGPMYMLSGPSPVTGRVTLLRIARLRCLWQPDGGTTAQNTVPLNAPSS